MLPSRSFAACAFGLLLAAVPAAAARLLEFPVTTASSEPYGITLGPDGRVWFTEKAAGKIGAMDIGGVVVEYPLSSATAQPAGIAVGADGALWFTEKAASKIGRCSLGGDISENATPTAASPEWIVEGGRGSLYFTNGATKIGRAETTGGITEIETAEAPADLAAGLDGKIHFTQSTANNVFALDTSSDTYGGFGVGDGTTPSGIAYGTYGLLFVGMRGLHAIRVFANTNHDIPLSTPGGDPGRMIARNDEIWFLDGVGKIGRIKNGQIYEYDLPAPAKDLTVGPDGNIWLTFPTRNTIGSFTPHLVGDVNDDGKVDVLDVFYIINFLFAQGPEPIT